MRKSEKFTQIYFNEADPMMEITTHNADLKKRLRRFAEEFPELCRVTEIDGGKMSFEIAKHRCSLRLTKAFTNAAQTAVSDLSKQAGSVSDSFSSALRNERSEMQRFRRRLFWISLLPTAITLASLLAWTLWLR